MNYRHVKEPLQESPLEMLLLEIHHQSAEAARPADSTGDTLADFTKKAEVVSNCLEAYPKLKTEILRRFAELEERATKAERQLAEAHTDTAHLQQDVANRIALSAVVVARATGRQT